MDSGWLEREIELNRRHEEIVSRREQLLRKSYDNLDDRELFNSSLASQRNNALKRNKKLLQEIDMCKDGIQQSLGRPQSSELVTLKVKYWAMVDKELPAWKSDVKSAGRSNPPSAR
ncbi:centrosomal protein 15-like [Diadema setosum]|uniref:centrosomal protein 15-like n=1 Tax=Diadema setosum TaxID=31175 RepID=UPI003B3AD9D3